MRTISYCRLAGEVLDLILNHTLIICYVDKDSELSYPRKIVKRAAKYTRRLAKKAILLIGSVVALTLLLNSVAYACSKLGSVGMAMAMHGGSIKNADNMSTDDMSAESVERGPCAQHKQDICKSVRVRMISTQPSLSKAGDYQEPAPVFLTVDLVIDTLKHPPLSWALKWDIAFHSVFKLPLTLFLSVLRI